MLNFFSGGSSNLWKPLGFVAYQYFDFWSGPASLVTEKIVGDCAGPRGPVCPLPDHLQQVVGLHHPPQLGHQLAAEKDVQSRDKVLVSQAEEVWIGGVLDGGPVLPLSIQNIQEKLERVPGEVLNKDLILPEVPKQLCLYYSSRRAKVQREGEGGVTQKKGKRQSPWRCRCSWRARRSGRQGCCLGPQGRGSARPNICFGTTKYIKMPNFEIELTLFRKSSDKEP